MCISWSPPGGLSCSTQVLPTMRTACSTPMSVRGLFSHFQPAPLRFSPAPAASLQTPGFRAYVLDCDTAEQSTLLFEAQVTHPLLDCHLVPASGVIFDCPHLPSPTLTPDYVANPFPHLLCCLLTRCPSSQTSKCCRLLFEPCSISPPPALCASPPAVCLPDTTSTL